MTRINLLKATTAILALQGAAMISPALAQQDAETEEAESRQNVITVTARKTEESILDAPLAITAFGSEDIQELGLNNIGDIQLFTPGFSYEAFASLPGRFDQSPRFRGVTVNSFAPFRQTGSVFVDGVPVINAASGLGLNELERVEVIKGPQSAFFGRNTFAGAINYITKTPSDEFGGQVSGTVASRNLYELAGEVEGPIADGLSGRASFSYRDKGGHYDNVLGGGELGAEETLSITGALYYAPNEDFSAKLRVNYLENNDGAPATFNVGQAFANCGAGTNRPLGGTRATICGSLPVGAALDAGSLASISEFSQLSQTQRDNIALAIDTIENIGVAPESFGFAREGVNVGFQFDWDLTDNITLSGNTGYSEDKTGILRDADVSAQDFYFSYSGRKFETISQEIRLAGSAFNDRLDWMFGYNYLDQSFQSNGGFLDGTTGGGFFGAPFSPSSISEETIENNAVFGSLSFDVTDRTTIGLEGRYQEEEVGGEVTFDNFLPRILIDHKLTDSTLLYATWSVGNLSGGVNTNFNNLTDAQRAEALSVNPLLTSEFDEEELEQIEVGLKHGFSNGSVSIAVYDIQRNKVANRFTTALPLTNGGRTFTAFINNGDAEFRGIEIEGNFQLNESIGVSGSFGYVDAEFGPFNSTNALRTTGSLEVEGNTPPRFPGMTGSFSIFANGDITPDVSWFGRIDNSYLGEMDLDDANFTHLSPDVLTNIRVGIEHGPTRYEAFATNVFDSDRPTGAAESADLGVGFFNFTQPGYLVTLRDKSQVGLRISHSF